MPWRTRQGHFRPLPVRRPAAIEKCLRGCATAWERPGQSYGLKELGRRDLGGWLHVLVSPATIPSGLIHSGDSQIAEAVQALVMRAGIVVNVMPEDRRRLEAIVSDRNASQKHVWRAKIILATADGCGTDEIMRRSGKAEPVVWLWQARFMAEGVAGLTRDKTRQPGKPIPCGHRAGGNPEIEGAEHERGEERAIGDQREDQRQPRW
jgi:hypothetical protein